MTAVAANHGSEFRRCLIEGDVHGIVALHKHVNPHLPEPTVADALVSLHMARMECKFIPEQAKRWSRAWLLDNGYQRKDGKWQRTTFKEFRVFADAVGISSGFPGRPKSPFNHRVEAVMEDSLLNSLAKGVFEPEMQKEGMMKARAKLRFRMRLD